MFKDLFFIGVKLAYGHFRWGQWCGQKMGQWSPRGCVFRLSHGSVPCHWIIVSYQVKIFNFLQVIQFQNLLTSRNEVLFLLYRNLSNFNFSIKKWTKGALLKLFACKNVVGLRKPRISGGGTLPIPSPVPAKSLFLLYFWIY